MVRRKLTVLEARHLPPLSRQEESREEAMTRRAEIERLARFMGYEYVPEEGQRGCSEHWPPLRIEVARIKRRKQREGMPAVSRTYADILSTRRPSRCGEGGGEGLTESNARSILPPCH